MIEIYSKENCIFCERAKVLLRDRQVPFIEHKLNVDFTKEVLMERYSNATTFPVIVVDGFHIGGYDQLLVRLNEEIQNTKKLLNEGV
jgi:glutaredoxin